MLERRRARRRAQIRRRRITIVAVTGAVAIGVVVGLGLGTGPRPAPAGVDARKALSGPGSALSGSAGATRAVVVSVRLVPWQLPAPVSREVVLPVAARGDLWVLGGLDASGATTAATYLVDPRTGKTVPGGSLATATHDAGGVLVGGKAIVFGGGTAAPAAGTEEAAIGGGSRLLGQLPEARSDLRAVTIGNRAYVVGGYDGPSMDPAVLETSNGRVFGVVATLPVPVRYPAVSTLGGDIYVFGGQGPGGLPVSSIQVVDPRDHRSRVVGHLPVGLSAAVAGEIDGTIYIVGGLVAGPGGTTVPVKAVYAYEPSLHRVRLVAALSVAVANAGAGVLAGALYVVGGETTTGAPSPVVQVVSLRQVGRGRR